MEPQTTRNGRWTITRQNDVTARIENNVTMFADTALRIDPRGHALRSYLVYDSPERIPQYVRRIAAKMLKANDY